MKPGIYSDISNEQYHSSTGISRSGLTAFRRSALHYWHEYLNPYKEARESSTAMTFGTALHELILEPEKFKENYLIVPKVNKTTKIGKKIWADIQETKGNRTILDEKIYSELCHLKESVFSNHEARALIEDAVYENSIYWNDSDTDVICKARPDIMHKHMIVDLKTTENANEHAFKYSIYEYGYHIQAAMLIDGYNSIQNLLETGISHSNFIIIAVEKKAPYASRVIVLSEETIQKGREIYKSALVEYKKCLESNVWSTYETITI